MATDTLYEELAPEGVVPGMGVELLKEAGVLTIPVEWLLPPVLTAGLDP